MSVRPYAVVLYGASGFVGQQTVQYFARDRQRDTSALSDREGGQGERDVALFAAGASTRERQGGAFFAGHGGFWSLKFGTLKLGLVQ